MLPGLAPAIVQGGTPIVAAVASSSQNSASTSASVSLPSGISAGDLLVVLIAGAAGTYSAAGWTVLVAQRGLQVLWKIATGTEGASVTVTTPSSKSAHLSYRISGASTIEASAVNGVDPPSLSPSWGSLPSLFIATAAVQSTVIVSPYPTDYANQQSSTTSSGSAYTIGSAQRNLNAASDDPSTFGFEGVTTASGAATLAVRPS